ncbi:alpha/beta fold hydrolase [Paenibacillus sp. JDR-2]|uniref:alpha/beta fold hydrolase n=1 Tax=Paenibacillus sp. (strain JDR-2) TaxID=324057 RepID=UPI000166A612|nr:alpha/beta hydrolase [Paenibacillus sp. JDR-2]ACT00527.1 alpha/beta hydrolase fold protein [Paenibacillus sp. JDR-2]
MDKHKVNVNGIDMVYEECGQENEKAIILLHGFCGSSHYWHNVCPLLTDHYRVIMPQLRGHGETSVPDNVYTMEVMADDINALIEKLGIDKTVVFGHSLGGYVTLALADKYPDKLAGFGLIHSTALPDTEEVKRKRYQDISFIQKEGIEPYVHDLIPKLFKESKRQDMPDEVEKVKEAGLKMSAKGAIHTLEGMMMRPDRSAMLHEACYPILLVAGAEDEVVSPDDTFSVNDKETPKSTYEYPHIQENTFEGVAHMSLVEAPEQLARVIANYLRTLSEKEPVRAL